jgi:hypothetical protein
VKKLVATVAAAAALLVPVTTAAADESCRVCVAKCGYGYRVYWYDLDGNYQLLFNGCIY